VLKTDEPGIAHKSDVGGVRLGSLLVIGAGGVLVEILAERAVLLAPVTPSAALAALRCPAWPATWATPWLRSTSTPSSAPRPA